MTEVAPRTGRHGRHAAADAGARDEASDGSADTGRHARVNGEHPSGTRSAYGAPSESAGYYAANGYYQAMSDTSPPRGSASASVSPAGRSSGSGRRAASAPVDSLPSAGIAGDIAVTPMRGRHATGWGTGFGRVVGWTLAGSAVPGTGLIVAGRKRLGGMILGCWLFLCLTLAALTLVGDPVQLLTKQLLAHPERLTYAAGALVVVTLLWAAHVIGTNVTLRRFAVLTRLQASLSSLLVVTLVTAGLATAAYAGSTLLIGRDALGAILTGDATALTSKAKRPTNEGGQTDPWANTPRINVLLIGSDAGADRTGLRTDSLIVASIDTRSGETVLFGIPRNLERVPFPVGSQQAVDFPDGFLCPEHACMINALWQFGVEHKDTYYKGEKNPGLAATVQGVQETLGLTIDDYAMLDLRGFMQFVDAIGGLTLNVPRAIPVGGHKDPVSGVTSGVTSYLKPGRQRLNGYQTLWFARSRSDSDDYERMRRQRCVIGAITQQADPQTIALNLPDIMKAARDNIRTSIPVSEVEAWVTLTQRVKKAHVRSLPFTDAVINSGHPDFDKIHRLVQEALNPPATTATASPSEPTPSGTGSRGAQPSAKPTRSAEQAVDVNAVC